MSCKDWLRYNDDDETWDQGLAEEILGSLVLVGITYQRPDGAVFKRKQLHGYVRSVDRQWGITLAVDGKDTREEFNFPPILDISERAELVIYEDGPGNIVRDPDFMAYWTVTSPTS